MTDYSGDFPALEESDLETSDLSQEDNSNSESESISENSNNALADALASIQSNELEFKDLKESDRQDNTYIIKCFFNAIETKENEKAPELKKRRLTASN